MEWRFTVKTLNSNSINQTIICCPGWGQRRRCCQPSRPSSSPRSSSHGRTRGNPDVHKDQKHILLNSTVLAERDHFLHHFLVGLLPLRSTRDCHEMNTELENYLSQSLLYLPSTVLRSSHNVSVMSKLLVGLYDRPVTKTPWGSWGKEEKPVKIVGAVSSDFSPSVAIKDPEIPKTATLMVTICEQYINDWIRTRHLGPLGPLRECEHGHPRKKCLNGILLISWMTFINSAQRSNIF